MTTLWRVALTVPMGSEPIFARALEDDAVALTAIELAPGGPWRVEALYQAAPVREALAARLALAAAARGLPEPAVIMEPVEPADWLAVNRASFRRVEIGRVVIRPSHDGDPLPVHRIGLTLDAGIAFGTGEHGTTQGCLLALQRLAAIGRVERVLDLGCGTGILAMAAARLWPGARVRALDVDRDAVATTRDNARVNAMRLAVARCARRPALGRGRHDVIVANILARPLVALAGTIVRALRPRGRVVLSGLLVEQEAMVAAAYRARGLVLRRRLRRAGWATLVFARP